MEANHKPAYRLVIEDYFPGDERLQDIAAQEMTYVRNHTGGRPSSVAHTASYWLKKAVDENLPVSALASPTAQAMLRDYREHISITHAEGTY